VTRTILHVADVHLEASFSSSGLPPAVGARRRQDLRAAFERALSLARKHRVDAVTIAGDLYDGCYALPETGSFLADALASLGPIPAIIAPGCADPYGDDSVYALTRWPDNVTILPPGAPSAVRVASDLIIWGAAWGPEGLGELPQVNAAGDERHLLLLHVRQAAGDGGGPSLPAGLTPETVRAAGFDFALLGGSHVGDVWPHDNPCGCFPGSLEPLAPDEMAGSHGAAVVQVADDGACAAEWSPVGRWRYVSLAVDLGACVTPDQAARRIESALKRDRVRTDARAIASVTITRLPEEGLDLSEVQGLIETQAHLTIRAERLMPYDLDRLAQEHTVRGLLVRHFRASLDAGQPLDDDLKRNALTLALRALDGKGVRPGEIA
jgi:DNA repair protein SbcD/Mre11